MSGDSLVEHLAPAQIFVHQEIDSTNAEAKRLLRQGQKCPFVVLARQQSAGKGRRGRVWESPPGAGLYYSLALELADNSGDLAALSLVTALGVVSAIESFKVQGLGLKWPNDVIAKGKKLSGILLERSLHQGKHHLVIGIGVNLSLPAEVKAKLERPATDLAELRSEPVDQDQLAAAITNQLLAGVDRFLKSGFAGFQADWNRRDIYIGQQIRVELGELSKQGEMLGVEADGALRLLTPEGEEVVRGGEIFPTVRPMNSIGVQ